MIEKGAACHGQFDAARASRQELRADLFFKVTNLATQGRLGRVQFALCSHRKAFGVCNGNEIAQVS